MRLNAIHQIQPTTLTYLSLSCGTGGHQGCSSGHWLCGALLQMAVRCPGGWTGKERDGATGEASCLEFSSAPAALRRTAWTWTTSVTVMLTQMHGTYRRLVTVWQEYFLSFFFFIIYFYLRKEMLLSFTLALLKVTPLCIMQYISTALRTTSSTMIIQLCTVSPSWSKYDVPDLNCTEAEGAALAIN